MRTNDGIEFRILLWDWKAQPNLAEISRQLQAVYHAPTCPVIQEVPNTGQDSYAVVISTDQIDPQAAWNQFQENDWYDIDMERQYVPLPEADGPQ